MSELVKIRIGNDVRITPVLTAIESGQPISWTDGVKKVIAFSDEQRLGICLPFEVAEGVLSAYFKAERQRYIGNYHLIVEFDDGNKATWDAPAFCFVTTTGDASPDLQGIVAVEIQGTLQVSTGGGGTGLVDDVKVDGVSVVRNKVADITGLAKEADLSAHEGNHIIHHTHANKETLDEITAMKVVEWDGKQASIADLAQIRQGAAAGSTALQPAALAPYRTAEAQDAIHDATKQDKLIAGANITIAADGKTISATGGGGSTPLVDDLTSDRTDAALAARQGKALKRLLDGKMPFTDLGEVDDPYEVMGTLTENGNYVLHDGDFMHSFIVFTKEGYVFQLWYTSEEQVMRFRTYIPYEQAWTNWADLLTENSSISWTRLWDDPTSNTALKALLDDKVSLNGNETISGFKTFADILSCEVYRNESGTASLVFDFVADGEASFRNQVNDELIPLDVADPTRATHASTKGYVDEASKAVLLPIWEDAEDPLTPATQEEIRALYDACAKAVTEGKAAILNWGDVYAPVTLVKVGDTQYNITLNLDDFFTSYYIGLSNGTYYFNAEQRYLIEERYMSQNISGAGSTSYFPSTKAVVDYVGRYHDATKQDTIADLATIRSGASLGATALQSVPMCVPGSATYAKAGLVKPNASFELTSDGRLRNVDPDNAKIDSRSGGYVVTLGSLDYAVKVAMCDGKGAVWTDAQKSAARSRMDAADASALSALDTRVQALEADYLTALNLL